MVTWPVSRRSRDEAPTEMVYVPPAVVQPLLQYWKLRAASVTVTCWVWPGSRFTRWKARRLRGGSPTAAGWVRYTWGTSASDAGNVTGSLPEKLASPNSSAAMALPSSCPGYQFSMMPRTLPSHGMVTAEPLLTTTTVLGCAAATSVTSWFWSVDRSMFDRSAPSPSPLLTNTTAKLAFRAAVTAASCRFWFGMIQPRLSWLPPPSWK